MRARAPALPALQATGAALFCASRIIPFTSRVAAGAADPTPERWTAGWQVLGLAAEAAPDVAAVAARVLARCRPEGAALPEQIHLFAPVLRDAGLLA